MNKKNGKQEKGITLIALVITIIVMLILVAVTISIAVNGGLFDYAQKAAVDTNTRIAEEQDWANIGAGQDYEQLIAKYTTSKAKWTHTGTGTDVGDVYTTGGENFYVIGSDSTTVTLLAANCVDTRAEVEGVANANYNKQTETTHTVAFDSTVPYSNAYADSTIKGLVDSYVSSLGVTVQEGRLMLKDEAEALQTGHTDILFAKNFWLGSPSEDNTDLAWIVYGDGSCLGQDYVVFGNDSVFGLRPVIVISKSNI